MKSRILAVLFAVVLTAGTLAGCGSSKKADDTKTETPGSGEGSQC